MQVDAEKRATALTAELLPPSISVVAYVLTFSRHNFQLRIVKDACSEVIREELVAGMKSIRQIVREELDRTSQPSEDGEADSSDTDSEGPAGEDWKLIICVRHDLNMSVGKVAAQVGHAVHHAVTHSRWRDLKEWEGSGSKKITLKVDSEEQLCKLEEDAKSEGLLAESIQDAGHTEVAPGTTTVLAIGPAKERQLEPITGHLKALPDRAQQLERHNKKLLERAERLQKELDNEKRKHKTTVKQLWAHRQVL
ncbi:unnamed protein product [Effrenium voratum]|uniref:peptidyl-tRNA hydrolase n=1 Tax=Effrenium voratum TaxID=2562239 RepID=A0AA36MJT7_9DINO|nr:unnamed protein product [Effrenium voratum]